MALLGSERVALAVVSVSRASLGAPAVAARDCCQRLVALFSADADPETRGARKGRDAGVAPPRGARNASAERRRPPSAIMRELGGMAVAGPRMPNCFSGTLLT